MSNIISGYNRHMNATSNIPTPNLRGIVRGNMQSIAGILRIVNPVCVQRKSNHRLEETEGAAESARTTETVEQCYYLPTWRNPTLRIGRYEGSSLSHRPSPQSRNIVVVRWKMYLSSGSGCKAPLSYGRIHAIVYLFCLHCF